MKSAQHIGIYLKLNTVNDKDIIDRLEDVRKRISKQGYIKDLIRTDIQLDSLRTSFQNGVTHVKKGE